MHIYVSFKNGLKYQKCQNYSKAFEKLCLKSQAYLKLTVLVLQLSVSSVLSYLHYLEQATDCWRELEMKN